MLTVSSTTSPVAAAKLARGLHARAQSLAEQVVRRALRTILPGLTRLDLESQWETGDEGTSFLSYGAITLTFSDGRTTCVPHQNALINGDWPEYGEPKLSEDQWAALDATDAPDDLSDTLTGALALLARDLGISSDDLDFVIAEASTLLEANYANPCVDMSPDED